VPGFAVGFEAHGAGAAVGVEAEHGGGAAGVHGEDVEDVEGDDVGDEEVDVVGGVDGAAFADGVGGAGLVGSGAEGASALDLDAEKLLAVVDDEVVALAVSPGLGDAEAEADGFEEKGGFGEFSGALGVGTGDFRTSAFATGVLATGCELWFGGHNFVFLGQKKARLEAAP